MKIFVSKKKRERNPLDANMNKKINNKKKQNKIKIKYLNIAI